MDQPSSFRDDGAQTGTPRRRREAVLDLYNGLLALFLFVSPWLFGYVSVDARIDIWLSGAVIALVSLASFVAFSRWEEWLNLLLGVWLVASPWVLGFAHTRAMHFSIGIGLAVTFLAALELFLMFDNSSQTLEHTMATHTSTIDQLRGSAALIAALIGVSVIFVWISRGTQFHQFAIGIMLSALTLGVALALFELCWHAILRAVRPSD